MKNDLRVERADLIDALKKLKKLVKRKTPAQAFLSFEKGMLVVSLDGISIECSAEGQFPGIVRIPGVKALTLSEVLPLEDPLTIGHDKQRLYIGPFSMSCGWLEGKPEPIQVPTDAPIRHMLALRLKYSEEQILKSGLSGAVHNARAVRTKLEHQAAYVLEPLGVTLSDIQTLVENCLRHSSGVSPLGGGTPRPTFDELASQALEDHRMLHADGKCREGSEQHERFMKKMAKWM
jgi:hypothetical protein